MGIESKSHFRQANIALFIAGFVIFSILYSTQPLMPVFSEEFDVSPAQSSLSLSLATATLAIFLLLSGPIAEAKGRKWTMSLSMFVSSLLIFAAAFVPDFTSLLFLRTLQGIALAGVPAIAMAYLSAEMPFEKIGLAMGMYISGTSIGGMVGRIGISTLTDLFSWRVALGMTGVLCLLGSIYFWKTLPSSKSFQKSPFKFKNVLPSLIMHAKNPRLLCLFGIAFLIMGSFVAMYNYLGYKLMSPPYNMSQTAVGWIFIIYLFGTFSSTWMGKLSDKIGVTVVLVLGISIMFIGALLTLFTSFIIKIVGLILVTFGLFGSHSIASNWVGKIAKTAKAQASSLYLLFYYMGSSIAGFVGGFFWKHFEWKGVITMIISFLSFSFILLAILIKLNKRQKRHENTHKDPLAI